MLIRQISNNVQLSKLLRHSNRFGYRNLFNPSRIGCQTTASITSSAKPTFTKEEHGNDSIKGVVLAFVGGFAGTIFVLSLTSKAEAPSRLLPNKYNILGLQESRRCSSPSEVTNSLEGDHVLLRIEPPFYIAPPKLTHEQALATAAGDPFWRILSVHMKEPSLQIERPYTPLYADAVCGPRGKESIELLIKRYPDGELGRYAHRVRNGEGIELRGPHVTWQDKQVDNLVLVSKCMYGRMKTVRLTVNATCVLEFPKQLVAGTGITPAYQLITTIFGKPERPMPTGQRIPRISLLYAASKPSSLLLLPELAKLKDAYGNRLDIQLFVEEEENKIKRSWLDWLRGKEGLNSQEGFLLHHGRMNEKAIKPILEKHDSNSRHILVCGPDGMIAQMAGAKKGNVQEDLSGILASLGCKAEEVHKL